MKINLLHTNLGPRYTEDLLLARGITDLEKFLNPDESCLQTYKDLSNIDTAVDCLAHLAPDAKIALIVDCDVDGYTSSAIIYQYLKEWQPTWNITPYLHDGKAHGLEEHWEAIQAEDYQLVLIPDAGSNDHAYAEQIHCPIIILDHHLMDQPASSNMIVVNNQTSPAYQNKDLSGAGVAFQFCRALDDARGEKKAEQYIDLAALGVCGDMMSGLQVENQYLWKTGFKHINNYFFMTLARKQAYSITGKMYASDDDIIKALNPTSVAFYIVPLINAMIRVGSEDEKKRLFQALVDGHSKVPCLKRGAKGTFEEVAVESTRECVNARAHQNKFKDDAVLKLEQRIFKYDLLENTILFIELDETDRFPSELNGLIAMQLAQKYQRPTIVARRNDQNFVRGSIRGLSNSALTSFKHYLDKTGLCEYVQGHDNAAGISIDGNLVDSLINRANDDLKDYNFLESQYDVEFARQALDNDLIKLITDIAQYKDLWAQQNSEPLIYIKDLHCTWSDIQIMGKNHDTVKIMKNGVAYMKFFAKDMIAELEPLTDIKLEVVGRANMNEWNGIVTPQIFIENYQITEDKLTDF